MALKNPVSGTTGTLARAAARSATAQAQQERHALPYPGIVMPGEQAADKLLEMLPLRMQRVDQRDSSGNRM